MSAVVLPLALPMLTALALLACRDRRRMEVVVSLISGAMLIAAAVALVARTYHGAVLVHAVGDWVPSVGIVWVVDRLSALMLLLTSVTSFATLLYASGTHAPNESRLFAPLHQLLLLGINGAFVTGDLFNLFVFFEVMLVSSYVLVALGQRKAQLGTAFTYVVMNLIASVFLFAGVGVVYGTAGTVNMAELAVRIQDGALSPAFWGGMTMVLVVFGMKAAVLPFFFWLPEAYPRAPLAVSAFFAGLLTKVGVYALFRTVPLFTGPSFTDFHRVLLTIAAATMLVGVIGALGRGTIRGVLSFHVVSQVGYMVFGLALFSPVALAAGIFYVVHHILVKTALFLAGGLAERVNEGGDLRLGGGLGARWPWLGAAFFVPAMALAGMPPSSGFWGKLLLLDAGFRVQAYGATFLSLVVSLLTLASMLKIWFLIFWGPPRHDPVVPPSRRALGAALGLGALSVAIGLGAAPVYAHAERAAVQLLDRQAYVAAVLHTASVGQKGRARP